MYQLIQTERCWLLGKSVCKSDSNSKDFLSSHYMNRNEVLKHNEGEGLKQGKAERAEKEVHLPDILVDKAVFEECLEFNILKCI